MAAGAAFLGAVSMSSGCTDAGTTPLETLTEAVARTLAASTARASFTVTRLAPGPPTDVLRGEGVFDLENRIGTMRIHAVDLRLPYLSGDVDVVSHGDVQYLSVPPSVPLGRPWVAVDHRVLGQVPLDPLALDQLLSADPSTSVRWLRGARGDVRRAGGEDVRGEPATRFEAVIGVGRASEQAPVDLRPSMGRLASRFGRGELPTAVWIGDDDGRVRRLALRLEPLDPAGETYVLTVELYDFGPASGPVAVAVPVPDQVAPVGELLTLPPPRPARRR